MCTHASNERTSSVSSRVSPRPRQIAVRSGLATAQARFASTESRHSATASSRSRPAKRGSSAAVRATISSSSRSSMVGVPRFCASRLSCAAMCTTRSCAVSPFGVTTSSASSGRSSMAPRGAPTTTGTRRSPDRRGPSRATRARGRARGRASDRAVRAASVGTQPRGDARQPFGLVARDRDDARARLRSPPSRRVRTRRARRRRAAPRPPSRTARVRAHHSPPSASSGGGDAPEREPQPRLGRPLRDAERLRDLPVGLAAEVRELHRSPLLLRQQVERGADPLGGERARWPSPRRRAR